MINLLLDHVTKIRNRDEVSRCRSRPAACRRASRAPAVPAPSTAISRIRGCTNSTSRPKLPCRCAAAISTIPIRPKNSSSSRWSPTTISSWIPVSWRIPIWSSKSAINTTNGIHFRIEKSQFYFIIIRFNWFDLVNAVRCLLMFAFFFLSFFLSFFPFFLSFFLPSFFIIDDFSLDHWYYRMTAYAYRDAACPILLKWAAEKSHFQFTVKLK